MLKNLDNYRIILASKSPRRQELLKGLDVEFQIKTLADVKEDFPADISSLEVAKFIAKEKADAYLAYLQEKDLIITADTVVVADNEVLGKPKDRAEAVAMIHKLSGRKHHVVTGVCIQTREKQVVFDTCTEVEFATLTEDEINYYVDTYAPYDKAGAYGVQEWIGYIGVVSITGSYFNVMGLPVQRLYTELKKF